MVRTKESQATKDFQGLRIRFVDLKVFRKDVLDTAVDRIIGKDQGDDFFVGACIVRWSHCCLSGDGADALEGSIYDCWG